MNSFSNSGKLFGAFPCIFSLSIYLAALPPISTTVYLHTAYVSAGLVAMYVMPSAMK